MHDPNDRDAPKEPKQRLGFINAGAERDLDGVVDAGRSPSMHRHGACRLFLTPANCFRNGQERQWLQEPSIDRGDQRQSATTSRQLDSSTDGEGPVRRSFCPDVDSSSPRVGPIQRTNDFVPATANLHARLGEYTSRAEQIQSPSDVLDELHGVTTSSLPLSVLGAARLPLKSSDWDYLQLGRSMFLHKEIPKGWWDEYSAIARGSAFRPLFFLAQSSLAAYTWTEMRRMLDPIGADRTVYELALKYGMRDGLTCPIGGRWVVVFWSPKVLSSILTGPTRVLIFAAANISALRLEQLVDLDPKRVGLRSRITPRELAVLRLISMGAASPEIAKTLGLGDETVRTHAKKAQMKLGARNRAQAVAEALRQNLIP